MADEVKSLSAWRLELQKLGKSHWPVFYKTMLNSSLSVQQKIRLYKALNLYGDWALFEAIIATSDAVITGDPLNYVIAVTKSKWKEMQQDEEEEAEYKAEIEAAKEITDKQNDELAKKLRRVNGK